MEDKIYKVTDMTDVNSETFLTDELVGAIHWCAEKIWDHPQSSYRIYTDDLRLISIHTILPLLREEIEIIKKRFDMLMNFDMEMKMNFDMEMKWKLSYWEEENK